LASKLSPPKFFTISEWKKMNDKEKIWIVYEDIWIRKGIGDGHWSRIEGIVIQILTAFTALKIWGLPEWMIIFIPFILFLSWFLKIKTATYLDAKDLVALSLEPGNRRNKVFRELRCNIKGGRK